MACFLYGFLYASGQDDKPMTVELTALLAAETGWVKACCITSG